MKNSVLFGSKIGGALKFGFVVPLYFLLMSILFLIEKVQSITLSSSPKTYF